MFHCGVCDCMTELSTDCTLPVPMLLAHTCTQVRWLSQPQPQPLSESAARLMNLRVYDNRDSSCKPAHSPSLQHPPHAHAPHDHMHSGPLVSCASGQTTRTQAYCMFSFATQCMRCVLDFSVLAFSLSLYRHPSI